MISMWHCDIKLITNEFLFFQFTSFWEYFRVKAVQKGDPLRPKQGPKTKLTADTEKLMCMYIEEYWEFGMPKKKQEFKYEIVHYMECYNIPNTFPHTIPGDFYEMKYKNVFSHISNIASIDVLNYFIITTWYNDHLKVRVGLKDFTKKIRPSDIPLRKTWNNLPLMFSLYVIGS